MKKKILKPFDIEKAKAGAEVCTRDGHKARIICFDRKTEGDYTILALIGGNYPKEEYILYFRADGKRIAEADSGIDLMLVEYEEDTPKFDTPKFEPFQKVLVRDNNDETWKCNFYSHYVENIGYNYRCINANYKQCIPYEGNEHLAGTNNKP